MTKHICSAVSSAFFLSILVVATIAQTCPYDQPLCYFDQNPMPGHGGAGSLPPDRYTPCNCPDDNRRVITIRIDGSWDVDPNGNATPGNTNVNIWNAAQCASNQWNAAQDP